MASMRVYPFPIHAKHLREISRVHIPGGRVCLDRADQLGNALCDLLDVLVVQSHELLSTPDPGTLPLPFFGASVPLAAWSVITSSQLSRP